MGKNVSIYTVGKRKKEVSYCNKANWLSCSQCCFSFLSSATRSACVCVCMCGWLASNWLRLDGKREREREREKKSE